MSALALRRVSVFFYHIIPQCTAIPLTFVEQREQIRFDRKERRPKKGPGEDTIPYPMFGQHPIVGHLKFLARSPSNHYKNRT